MKIDKLEEFIGENRAEFDCELPPADLFDSIEENRKKAIKRKLSLDNILKIGAIAASIFLPVSLTFLLLINLNKSSSTQNDYVEYQVSEEVEELMEIQAYYSPEINEKKKELKQLLVDNPELAIEIDEVLYEMEESYAVMNLDLSQNMNNKKIMDAMVNHQRMTLTAIDDMISQINKTKM